MKTDEEYDKLYQSRYKVEKQLKEEILKNHEREESAKKARWDLMMDLNRCEERYDNLQADFRKLLIVREHGDKSE